MMTGSNESRPIDMYVADICSMQMLDEPLPLDKLYSRRIIEFTEPDEIPNDEGESVTSKKRKI
jgi:hypothetical protein